MSRVFPAEAAAILTGARGWAILTAKAKRLGTLLKNSTIHILFVAGAAGAGLLSGFGAQFLIKTLALFTLLGGPGLYEGLMAFAERADVFWTVAGYVAAGTAAVLYVIWGIVWLISRPPAKGSGP